jgi:hypothetical protein
LQLREDLLRLSDRDRCVQVKDTELQSIQKWAAFLLDLLDKRDPLKTVLAVRDDFLGVYRYDIRNRFADEYAANRATIYIYWGIIGLVSEWMGCMVEDLSIVVMIHELAHACPR